MKNFLYRFMAGRYGNDSLNKFLTGLWLGAAVLSLFLDKKFISYIVWALCLLVLFRTFSRNIAGRQKENLRFLALYRRASAPFRRMRARVRDRKTHVFRRCPHCKKTLRLPRVPGDHFVNCPLCHTHFAVRVGGKRS